jgi:hypothetical protein
MVASGTVRFGFFHPGTDGGGFPTKAHRQSRILLMTAWLSVVLEVVRLIGCGIKPVPADHRGHDYRNKHQHQTNSGQTADPGPAEHINEGKYPHDGNTGNTCWHRVI